MRRKGRVVTFQYIMAKAGEESGKKDSRKFHLQILCRSMK